jgi:hypothetical protein
MVRAKSAGAFMTRQHLPNRRLCESFDVQVANLSYKVSVGRFSNGDLAEVFIMRDSARAMVNSDGTASGVAAAVLDKILGGAP